ncbi:helix-turn-helix domain-containing protein [Paenibacillus cymbidii]|uniref:helix-turn-helix domain-containing protein n=1 Tax=Paenibacillus cymbidii TaxID=1639034 RepID=UPI0014369EED|nr:helix-turn-helix domain-containing protein [Paenibacillus cymbidii]
MPDVISRSVLFKFLLSFLAVFMLPMLLLGFVIYRDSYVKVKSTLEQSALDSLVQLRGYADSRQRELQYTTERIRHDYTLQHYSILEGPEAQLRAIDRLNMYKADDSAVQEIMLYVREGSDLVFTSRGIITLQALAASSLRSSSAEQEQFLNMMRTAAAPYVRPSGPVFTSTGAQSDIMMYLFPIPPDVDEPQASLLYFVPQSGFAAITQSLLQRTGGSAGILDEQGRSLAVFGDRAETQQAVRPDDNRAISSVRIDGRSYTYIRSVSDRNGWTYWALLPQSAFYKPVSQKQTGLLLSGAGLLLIGLLLIGTLSFLHYRPMNRFRHALRRHFPESRRTRPRSEWKEIEANLDALRTRQAVTRRQIIENLLHQRETYAAKRHYVASGLLLDCEWTAVVLMRTEKEEAGLLNAEMEALMDRLEAEHAEAGIRLYCTGLERLSDCALLVNAPEPDLPALRLRLAAIRESLADRQLRCAFGIGSWQAGADGIHRSYVEASAALDKADSLTKEEPAIVAFVEMKAIAAPDVDWFPLKEQLRFLHSLKQGDAEEAEACLDEIVATVRRHASSFLLSKYVCLDLITQVIRTLQQEKLDYDPERLHHLLQFTGIDELEAMLTQIAHAICAEVALRKSRHTSTLAAQIVEGIDREYTRAEFGLDWVADRFQLSPSHVSKLVKAQTGVSFAQYLSDLRMEEAKRLLAETACPIHDIVQRIGYIDPKNFMRKFKNEVGITPGEFRKQHKREQPSVSRH